MQKQFFSSTDERREGRQSYAFYYLFSVCNSNIHKTSGHDFLYAGISDSINTVHC